jgi:hypothetical protein
MRRRDVAFLCVAFGGLLAGLIWALSTQSRWVQENQPLRWRQPAAVEEGAEPAAGNSTGVIGNVSDDTRTAMAKETESRRKRATEPVARPAPKARAGDTAKAGQEGP